MDGVCRTLVARSHPSSRVGELRNGRHRALVLVLQVALEVAGALHRRHQEDQQQPAVAGERGDQLLPRPPLGGDPAPLGPGVAPVGEIAPAAVLVRQGGVVGSHLAPHQRPPPVGTDDQRRVELVLVAVGIAVADPGHAPLVTEQLRGRALLAHVGPGRSRGVDERRVQPGAAHAERVVDAFDRRVAAAEVVPGPARERLGEMRRAERLDPLERTEPLQLGHAARPDQMGRQRVRWESRPVDRHHPAPGPRQGGRGGRAGTASADDHRVGVLAGPISQRRARFAGPACTARDRPP